MRILIPLLLFTSSLLQVQAQQPFLKEVKRLTEFHGFTIEDTRIIENGMIFLFLKRAQSVNDSSTVCFAKYNHTGNLIESDSIKIAYRETDTTNIYYNKHNIIEDVIFTSTKDGIILTINDYGGYYIKKYSLKFQLLKEIKLKDDYINPFVKSHRLFIELPFKNNKKELLLVQDDLSFKTYTIRNDKVNGIVIMDVKFNQNKLVFVGCNIYGPISQGGGVYNTGILGEFSSTRDTIVEHPIYSDFFQFSFDLDSNIYIIGSKAYSSSFPSFDNAGFVYDSNYKQIDNFFFTPDYCGELYPYSLNYFQVQSNCGYPQIKGNPTESIFSTYMIYKMGSYNSNYGSSYDIQFFNNYSTQPYSLNNERIALYGNDCYKDINMEIDEENLFLVSGNITNGIPFYARFDIGLEYHPIILKEHEEEIVHHPYKAFPNPTSNSFTIELDTISSGVYYLYDNTGSVILTKQFSDLQKLTIDLDKFSKGIYFLSVQTKKQSFFIKEIKR